ncbi:MAG TPA: hypothetical protein VIV12_22750 [Streptosporangiaceae bacterium]
MEWVRAQDTFVADLADGTSVRVVKGDPFPASHELVRRDREHVASAGKAGTDRAPLFKAMDMGEEEVPAAAEAPAPKAKASRAAAAKAKGA